MMTDNQILTKGMESLIKSIGIVESEKFISIILREYSDYSEWRELLFEGKSINEINNEAKAFWKTHK